MKRPRLFVLLLAFGLALAAFEVFSLDGLIGVFGASDDNTVYANGYSARKFRQIRTGMDVEQVLSLLGEPIGLFERGRDCLQRHDWSPEWRNRIAANPACLERFCYSVSNPPDSSYRIRDVLFEDGKVDRVFAEYYGD